MECGDAYLGVITIATAQQAQEVVMVNVKKGPPTCVWGHLRSSGCSGNVPHLDVGDGSLAVCCRSIRSCEEEGLVDCFLYIVQRSIFNKG